MEKFINCLSASVEMVLLQLYSLGSYRALKNHLQIFFSSILSIFKNVSLESNYVLVEATYYLLKNISFPDDGPDIFLLFLFYFFFL